MTQHPLEADRLESLATYDTDAELGLQSLAALAAEACQTPTAAINVVDADRLRSLAAFGGPPSDLPRPGTFCDVIVGSSAPLVVSDTRTDSRFRQHPWVRNGQIRSYAGVPIVGRDGLPLGVLCVSDTVTRDFTSAQLAGLRALADGVVNALELRRLDLLAGLSADVAGQGRRLRRALDNDELVTWFQPVVSLETGVPHALEALVRWEHPQRGILGPSAFLPAVERSGLSLPVGRRVLHRALRTLADLRSSSLLLVAVNVSPLQLSRPGLAASVLADLEAHRLEPSCLSIEVTEQGLRHDNARRELEALREAGVWVALDDYGTGRSSLRDLLDLPLTSVKLHGSLVARMPDARVQKAVLSTVALAADLGLGVVAEGVETEAQRTALLEAGCLLAQGHLFSPAVPASELGSYLAPGGVRAQHELLVSSDELVDQAVTRLETALAEPGPVVLIASVAHRVAVERALAARGVNCLQREGYSVIRSEDVLDDWSELTVPAGATVWSDLAGLLWTSGDVTRAIAAEDFLAALPATVLCAHETWALHAHGTPEQVRRLHEQHGTAYQALEVTAVAALRPDARDLIDRMRIAGASSHSIAAALTAEGHPSPSGVRWHWRQVDRLLA
jgi:EAL domain-containing protein (putative c-di-GMP-specific phosphodiesterase class I)